MKLHLPVMVGMVILGVALAATAGADNATKLVGIWEPAKAKNDAPASIEFTKDGKIKVAIKLGDKSFTIDGTYKVKDDKIATALNIMGQPKEGTLTIKKLTDKELQIVDDANGKVEEYKRVK